MRRDGRLPDQGIDVSTGRGLIVEETDFHSARHGHRLVDLRFGPADRRVPTAYAIVDLSAQQVADAGVVPEGKLPEGYAAAPGLGAGEFVGRRVVAAGGAGVDVHVGDHRRQ
ncbi:hypothetical protein [Nocardia sp. IFM 10818]